MTIRAVRFFFIAKGRTVTMSRLCSDFKVKRIDAGFIFADVM